MKFYVAVVTPKRESYTKVKRKGSLIELEFRKLILLLHFYKVQSRLWSAFGCATIKENINESLRFTMPEKWNQTVFA